MKVCYYVLFLLGLSIPSIVWGQRPQVDSSTRSRSSAPAINEVIPVMMEPQPINLSEVREMLRYPSEAEKENLEGTVVVRILVDEKGDYMRHQVISSPHTSFSREIDKHVKKLVFTPAIDMNRKETKYWLNLPFYFEMQKNNKDRN